MSLPTPEQLAALSPEFLAEDISRRALNAGIALIIVPTIFFALFIASRILHKARDPWYICALYTVSYVCVIALSILTILYAKIGGGGRHIAYHLIHDPSVITTYLKIQTSSELIYVLSITSPRLSVLLLYLNIFNRPLIRKITWGVFVLVSLNFIPVGIVEYFTICQPFAFKWDKTIDGHCANLFAAYTWISVPNIFLDVVILLLPIKTIWDLQVSPSRKAGIFLTLMLGGLGIITAIIRFVGFFTADLAADPTFNSATTWVYTVLEPGAYFMCSCMPYIRPLAVRFYDTTGLSQLTSRSFRSMNGGSSEQIIENGSTKHSRMQLHGMKHSYSADISASRGVNVSEDRIRFIQLEETVEVRSSPA